MSLQIVFVTPSIKTVRKEQVHKKEKGFHQYEW